MPLPIIKYPYLPQGREILYVPGDNAFMLAAKEQAEQHGCRKHATGAVAVKEDEIIASGKNAGTAVSVCPRVYKDYGTGQGYQYCKNYCEQDGHAEVVLCNSAKADSIDLNGADLYLYGHWWCCENCWNHMITAGINNVYLMEGSDKLFNYDFQSEDEINPHPPIKVYISGPLTHLKNPDIKILYEEIGELAESEGMTAHVPHLFTDPIKHADVSPEDVYQIDQSHLADSDLVIAYVGEPSLGVGMEIEMANHHKALVILLSEVDQKVARIATGSPNIIDHLTFQDKDDALAKIKVALQKFKKAAITQNVSVKQ